MKNLILVLMVLALFSGIAHAVDRYVDATAGGLGDGTSGDPFNWARLMTAGGVTAGDVIHLQGDFGVETYAEDGPIGAIGNHLIFQQWAGQTAVNFDALDYTNTLSRVVYHTWNVVPFSGQAMTTVGLSTLILNGSSSITFNNCPITSGSVTSAAGGDWAPYYPSNQHCVYAQNELGYQTNDIIFNGCTFVGGSAVISNASGDRWTLIDCTLTGFANNGYSQSASFGDDLLIAGCTVYEYESRKGMYVMSGSWDTEPAEGTVMTQDTSGYTLIYNRLNSSTQFEGFADDDTNPFSHSVLDDYNWQGGGRTWTPSGGYTNAEHSDGISIEGASTDIVIRDTVIYDVGTQAQGIKLGSAGGTQTGVDIYNCIIYSVTGNASGNYLMYSEGGTDTSIYNCVFDATASGSTNRGMRIAGAVTNFTLFNCSISGIVTSITPDYHQYILWFGSDPPWAAGTGEVFSAALDPLDIFEDYVNHDYTLDAADTDATDAGAATVNSVNAPAADIDGKTRNAPHEIGPYDTSTGGAVAPTVTTPTRSLLTDVTATTAYMGGNVTDIGSSVLTQRGATWGLAADPNANYDAEGATTTGVYSFQVTGLPSASEIYFSAYAKNIDGAGEDSLTGHSSAGSTFWTEPSSQGDGATFDNITDTTFEFDFFPGDGSTFIIIRADLAVNVSPVDGVTYATDLAFGGGYDFGSGNYALYAGGGEGETVTGLSAGTTYHLTFYSYAGSGTGESGINYLQTTPYTASQATTGTAPTSGNQIRLRGRYKGSYRSKYKHN